MSRAAGHRREWIPVGEATRLLGVSPATLRRWADAGRLSVFTTPGGHRRFERSAVLALLPRLAPRHAPVHRHVDGSGPQGRDELVLAALRGYLRTSPELRAEALRAAQGAARAYGCATRMEGLSTSETVAAFQRLRVRLLREITSSACGAATDGMAAAEALMAAVEGCDCLLEACVSGHESAAAPVRARGVAPSLAG
jgi:excisionase family DNA binding protein